MARNDRIHAMMVSPRTSLRSVRLLAARSLVALCFLQALIFAAPVFAKAEMSATDWLNAMTQSMQEKSYSGTFVYIRSGNIETMKIAHANRQDGVHQRLITLNGSRREVIRSPQHTICYLPDKRRAVLQQSPPKASLILGLPDDIESLAQIYQFELGGSERVADHDVRLVSMLPRDEHRYGRRFWIDEASYLPLKYDLVDHDGSMIERMLFTSLVLGLPSEQDLQATTDAADFDWIKHMPREGGLQQTESNWNIRELPSGFRLLSHERGQFAHSNSVEHMLLSDGVASVSVYIEDQQVKSPAHRLNGARFGAMHVFKSMQGEKQITVMGEVPKATVQLIGQSIQSSPIQ